MKPNLILIGYRGAGKTTCGRSIAERLGLELIDMDEVIEQRLGEPISDLFARGGEELFRREESAVLQSITQRGGRVIATGGGVVLRSENRARLFESGVVVYLVATTSTLASRIHGSARPSLTGAPAHEEVGVVLAQREPLYKEVAHHVVKTDGRTFEEICDELQQLWSDAENHHVR